MRANVPDTERVTIRCGARSASGADGSTSAGGIFYDDGLTERAFCSATTRASESVPTPGGSGTIIVIGRDG
jgi:hypothetical protein